MQDFYESFYRLAPQSPAHAEFCVRVFGKNLCQHGFADMYQLDTLIDALHLEPGQSALDLGCGNGMIAEYISDRTGAHITGLDYIAQAIEQAKMRTVSKTERLSFISGDINALELLSLAYNAIILIDSIYFSSDYNRTIADLAAALHPNGQIGILYSYGREPWVSKEDFPVDNLVPDCTPLATALAANKLTFSTQDFTRHDYQNAQRRKEVLNKLHLQFEAENIEFVWQNRMGDANGIIQAIEEGMHARYLYLAKRSI